MKIMILMSHLFFLRQFYGNRKKFGRDFPSFLSVIFFLKHVNQNEHQDKKKLYKLTIR